MYVVKPWFKNLADGLEVECEGGRSREDSRFLCLSLQPPAVEGKMEGRWFGVGGNGSLFRHVTSKHLSNMRMEIAWTGHI